MCFNRKNWPGQSWDLGVSICRVVGPISISSQFSGLAKSLNGPDFPKSLTDTQTHPLIFDHHPGLLWKVNLNSLYKGDSGVCTMWGRPGQGGRWSVGHWATFKATYSGRNLDGERKKPFITLGFFFFPVLMFESIKVICAYCNKWNKQSIQRCEKWKLSSLTPPHHAITIVN